MAATADVIAFAGKATLWVSEKIVKANVERGQTTWVDKLLADEKSHFDAVSAALTDNRERLDRNFLLIQDVRGEQYARQYTDAFNTGSVRIKAIWDSFQTNLESDRPREALSKAMTNSAPISVLLAEFQNALLPSPPPLGYSPLRAPFKFFSIAYSATTSHLDFGPRAFMEGLYAVTDAISSVQDIALIMVKLSESERVYSAIATRTKERLKLQKDEVFKDVLWKGAEDNPGTLEAILQKTGDAEAKAAFEEYYSKLESKMPLEKALYFRGVEQADRYLCCYYPSTAKPSFFATREPFVGPLSWAQVKKVVESGNSVHDKPGHNFNTPVRESVQWELWPTENKRPGFYHLNSVPRNTYVRHEAESKGAHEGKRHRPTILGLGDLMTFKLILSSDAKLEEGIIKGQLIETEQARWGSELPGWCGDTPITWSMAAADSQQATEDGWV